MYTINNMNDDFEAAKQIVINAGLTDCKYNRYILELSKRTSFLGQAHKNADYDYVIRLNKLYAETAEHDDVMETLVHEILHTLPHGMKHTGEWKYYASVIHNYNGMNIKRLHEATEGTKAYEAIRPHKTIAMTYVVHCPNCGDLKHYERRSKAVISIQKQEKRYMCPKCHSYDLTVFIKEV
jgi:predicted SprT family Zn-dependent metalloprotease